MKYSIIFIAVLFINFSSYAQTNISQIFIKYGVIENFQDDLWYEKYGNLDKTISIPEFSIGGNLARDYLYWSVYWGHWNDGVSEQLRQVVDFVTYSSSANILGLRLSLSSSILKLKTPVITDIITGFSHHFVTHKPVGGHGIDGKAGKEYSSSFNTAELGFAIGIKFWDHFKIFAEIDRYFILNRENQNQDTGKNACGLGLSYIF